VAGAEGVVEVVEAEAVDGRIDQWTR